jgi:hypothetical protein
VAQRKAQQQHKRGGGKGVEQGKAQRTEKFGGALRRSRSGRAPGVGRGAAAGLVAVAGLSEVRIDAFATPTGKLSGFCARFSGSVSRPMRSLCA